MHRKDDALLKIENVRPTDEKTNHHRKLAVNLWPVSFFERLSDSDDENTIRREKIALPNAGPPKAIECSFCPRKFIQNIYSKKHEEKHQR